MSKFNLQSLAFALVVLFLVVFGRREGADKLKTPTTSSIEVTSLASIIAGDVAREIPREETFEEKPAPRIATPMPGSRSAIVKNSSPTRAIALSPPGMPQLTAPIVNPYTASALESKPRVLNSLIPEPIGAGRQAPILNAAAVLVSEIGGYGPYLEKNIDKRWPLASLTKLMTSVVALENLPADQKIMVSERAVAAPGQAGNFAAGETFTAVDLLKALIVASSNDAAFALADFYPVRSKPRHDVGAAAVPPEAGGRTSNGVYGYEKFVDLMQIKAADLGMRQTTFFDPAGLSVLNQSTASDFHKLVNYILKNHAFIFRTSRETSTSIRELESGAVRILPNINQFAGEPSFLGGKTGYTDDANGNLISIFRHQDREFLIMVFGTSDRFGETEKLYEWLKNSL